jgi:excinuclease ABC subunit C
MDFAFHVLQYDKLRFLTDQLPTIPKHSGVYKIFDLRGKLIVLDKTSNLFERLERFYGERSEMVRDLDLREISSRIEYIRTDSAFETLYVLYRERKVHFPKTYRKMRTFRLYTLMKINRKQRFPRIYASRQIKGGVDYFGPFVTRGQFTRLKTTIERTFMLRPCLYNIRGNDPHPDCMYFQMHTCSRPCNNDVDRTGYLDDVGQAMLFIEGRDSDIENSLVAKMNELAAEMKFEDAELNRRRLEKIHKAREEYRDKFFSLANFNFVAVLAAASTSRRKMAFIRQGRIVGFEEYELPSLKEILELDLHRFFDPPPEKGAADSQYDEFCLVSNFIVDPLQSVDLLPLSADLPARVMELIERKRKRQKQPVDKGIEAADSAD